MYEYRSYISKNTLTKIEEGGERRGENKKAKIELLYIDQLLTSQDSSGGFFSIYNRNCTTYMRIITNLTKIGVGSVVGEPRSFSDFEKKRN